MLFFILSKLCFSLFSGAPDPHGKNLSQLTHLVETCCKVEFACTRRYTKFRHQVNVEKFHNDTLHVILLVDKCLTAISIYMELHEVPYMNTLVLWISQIQIIF